MNLDERQVAHRVLLVDDDDAVRARGTMGEEDSPKRCPTGQGVPLILLSLAGGTMEHARVGCLCRSAVLEQLSTEKSMDGRALASGTE